MGELSTMVLVPQVVDAVDLPVVAAGGIADGRGRCRRPGFGAAGVQVGTRFVCAAECVAHPRYKEAILKAGDRDAVVSGRSTGHPVRCLKNRFWKEFTSLEKAGAPPEELERLGNGKYHAAAILGDVENGSVLAGQAAAMVNKIQPAADIVTELLPGQARSAPGWEGWSHEQNRLYLSRPGGPNTPAWAGSSGQNLAWCGNTLPGPMPPWAFPSASCVSKAPGKS